MSRKRTRSLKTTPENPILIDEEVKERFDSIIKHQPMIPKKGFNLKTNDLMVVTVPIRKKINALKWEQFYDACSLLDDELVQEFSTNLTTLDATEVIVRKKKVPLTSKFINDLFNLPDVKEDEYYPLMNNNNWDFLQQVLDVMTNLGSQLSIRKYGSHSCLREYLIPVAKVLFSFVRYNFMPISHSSTILMEWMFLLYEILIKKSINVGKIILKEIHECAKKKKRSAYFPSLITSFRLRARVKTQANLKGQYIQRCITNHDLERLVGRVHELNQGEQDEPIQPDTKESTNETKTKANSIADIEEEESDKELSSPKPAEGSANPEPRVELEEKTVKLSVEDEFLTPIMNNHDGCVQVHAQSTTNLPEICKN
ncbi:hypothetical protein J1N35_018617 [Gossypium stocksii]|uniref:Putative plant transposon protein domain-containing protein n=1 Tax=Gossypium stocksii TaxID=47602 RepID=A0A9D4A791_9ROSI|nr:hypothetical protein J1N35_018617 [Gossypium stocksii]